MTSTPCASSWTRCSVATCPRWRRTWTPPACRGLLGVGWEVWSNGGLAGWSSGFLSERGWFLIETDTTRQVTVDNAHPEAPAPNADAGTALRAALLSFTVIALVPALAIGAPPVASAGQGRAEQARDFTDLSDAIRSNEAQRDPEALMHLAPYVRSHPSDVVGRSLLLDILLRRNWPLPIAELRHAGAVSSAQFSPDGQRVVTASDDGTARLWDAHTGVSLGGPMEHAGKVSCARFSREGALEGDGRGGGPG